MHTVTHYFDYKSPYAYLAQAPTYELAQTAGVTVLWLPYTLKIEKYLGQAQLDGDGHDVIGTRNDHQWRRVRYSYMDCRREANRRGLTIRGPRKIFDSSLAHIAYLYVREHAAAARFHDAVFERFWKRELDIENVSALSALMAHCGIDAGGFAAYLAGPGRALLGAIERSAEAAGVFGVPSYALDGDLYWGLERLVRVRERVAGEGPGH